MASSGARVPRRLGDEDIPSFTTHSPLLNQQVNSLLLDCAVCDYENVILPKPMHYVLAGLLITQTWMEEDLKTCWKPRGNTWMINFRIYIASARGRRGRQEHRERDIEMAQHNVDASKMELYTPKERDLRVHWAEPMLGSVCNIMVAPNRVGIG